MCKVTKLLSKVSRWGVFMCTLCVHVCTHGLHCTLGPWLTAVAPIWSMRGEKRWFRSSQRSEYMCRCHVQFVSVFGQLLCVVPNWRWPLTLTQCFRGQRSYEVVTNEEIVGAVTFSLASTCVHVLCTSVFIYVHTCKRLHFALIIKVFPYSVSDTCINSAGTSSWRRPSPEAGPHGKRYGLQVCAWWREILFLESAYTVCRCPCLCNNWGFTLVFIVVHTNLQIQVCACTIRDWLE